MPIGSRFPQVLEAAQEGLEWAWTELYREFAPPVLRFLRSQGAAEPEDLLAECFIQIIRNLATFSGDETGFRAWTFTIARSRLTDSWRRAGRRPVVPVTDPFEHAPEVSTCGPEDALMSEVGVTEILNQLTPDQRAVIALRFVDRFSLAETAEILGRSEGSVKLLQHRAIKALRKLLS